MQNNDERIRRKTEMTVLRMEMQLLNVKLLLQDLTSVAQRGIARPSRLRF
ncbi:MAG TPA: hypothetical protein VFB72_14405 [Verrucomicrobiae bacterium]|nr:hypothetical protein [Verrucomicrobiae bacterium]